MSTNNSSSLSLSSLQMLINQLAPYGNLSLARMEALLNNGSTNKIVSNPGELMRLIEGLTTWMGTYNALLPDTSRELRNVTQAGRRGGLKAEELWP